MKKRTDLTHTLKIILILTALLPLAAFSKGKEVPDTITARRAFVELPSGVLDLLPSDTRVDMLIYYDNDSIYDAPNNLQGKSRLTKVTSDFLEVELSPASTLQFKVLKLKNGKEILMTVYTIGAPGDNRDSEVAFYDSGLNPLPKEKYFSTPKLETFFDTKGYSTDMKEIEGMLPFYTFWYEASPDNDTLTGRLTYRDITTIEDAKIIELLVRPEVKFEWTGKNFKKQ